MNRGERIGIDVMLIALAITILILSYDFFFLYLRNRETISGHMWDRLIAWRNDGYKFWEFPFMVLILPFGVSFQAIGLLFHFIAGLARH